MQLNSKIFILKKIEEKQKSHINLFMLILYTKLTNFTGFFYKLSTRKAAM